MEAFEARLKRFLYNSPNEVFYTILNSIKNYTLPELKAATNVGLYRLAFLGAHAVMQTISEDIYAKKGFDATKFYLKNFVDGTNPGTDFSTIAKDLHDYRNTYAHQLSSRPNHSVGFDTSLMEGWRRDVDGLHINPVLFMDCFIGAFHSGELLKLPLKFNELTALQRKYSYLQCWLDLPKHDVINNCVLFGFMIEMFHEAINYI
jgi:hypothetical protein